MYEKTDFDAIKFTAWWKWVRETYEQKRKYHINDLIMANNIEDVKVAQGSIKALDAFVDVISNPEEYVEDLNND